MIILPPNKVAIKPIDDPDVSPGGIIIPDEAKERTDQGIVKYVGRDCKLVSIGDWVLFNGYSGTLIFLEGEGRLIILHERSINAICGPQDWATTEVSGLYHRTRDGDYFPATYEVATDLLIDCNKKWYAGIKPSGKYKKNEFRPSIEETEMDKNWTEDESLEGVDVNRKEE